MKRRTNLTKSLTLLAVAATMFALSAGTALAQYFENTASSSYTGSATSVIRMVHASGSFTGGGNIGEGVTVAGHPARLRIPGTVEWVQANPQFVQSRWYTNLTLDGAGTRTLGNASETIHVYGDYDNGYGVTGNRTYNAIFQYDGDNAQSIAREDNAAGPHNIYEEVIISGTGQKNVDLGDVYVANDFSGTADPTLFINGGNTMRVGVSGGTSTSVLGDVVLGDGGTTGTYEMNAGTISYGSVTVTNGDFQIAGAGDAGFGGDVTVTNGSVNLKDAGSASFTANVNVNGGAAANGQLISDDLVTGDILIAASGALTLGTGAQPGQLTVGQSTEMYVTGAFTNNHAAATNMEYRANSTVYYDGGAQSVVSTTLSNPYANLFMRNAGTKTAVGSVHVSEGFSMGDLGNTQTFTFTDIANDYIALTNGSASYYGGMSQVVGKFRRRNTGAADQLANSTEYTLNNHATRVTFATVPASGGYFQLDVRPNTTPNIQAPPAGTYDVQRAITANSDNGGAGSFGEISSIVVGYVASEYGGSAESRLRELEGDGGDRSEKIITGNPIAAGDRNEYTTTSWRSLRNTGTPATDYIVMLSDGSRGSMSELGQGHDIVLTDEESMIISIRNGRWSDPGTWDEGRTPFGDENVLIRDIVWTGDENALFGASAFADDEQTLPSTTYTPADHTVLLANRVTLDLSSVSGGDGRANVALVIYNNDTDQDADLIYTFGNNTGTDPGLINDNTYGSTGAWDGNLGSYGVLQGLWVDATGTNGDASVRASRIVNNGRITNNGIIEVGW